MVNNMANLFKRINDIIAANLNDLLDRVEDPERMIKQIIREMEENINSAKEGVIDAIASEKQLYRELESQRRQSKEWLQRAEKALAADNETLAREALTRKREHDAIVANLEESWSAAKRTSERLKAQLRTLEAKLNEARLKKGSLVARQRASEARRQMDRTLNHVTAGREMETSFGRMEDKVLEMEARVEAEEELYQDYSPVEQEFLQMEVDAQVEDELAALKKKMQAGDG